MMDELDDTELRQKLNLETGRIAWPEIQRHFARGAVLVVSPDLDLVEVGLRLARDDSDSVRAWTETGGLRHAEDEDARRWMAEDTELWAVVVAPWVLTQEPAGTAG